MLKQQANAVGRKRFTAIALSVTLLGSIMTVQAFTGKELAKDAKIGMPEARVPALKVQPGDIRDEELEQEKGSLRYSFAIRVGNTTHEIGIDAQTGKVLENSIEGPNPD